MFKSKIKDKYYRLKIINKNNILTTTDINFTENSHFCVNIYTKKLKFVFRNVYLWDKICYFNSILSFFTTKKTGNVIFHLNAHLFNCKINNVSY